MPTSTFLGTAGIFDETWGYPRFRYINKITDSRQDSVIGMKVLFARNFGVRCEERKELLTRCVEQARGTPTLPNVDRQSRGGRLPLCSLFGKNVETTTVSH